MCSAPVGNINAFKSPFVTENITGQVFIFSTPITQILIIGSHHSQSTAFLYSRFEGRQIDFTKGTLATFYLNGRPVRFLVIQGKMFHAASDITALQSLNILNSQNRVQIRIFTHIFEVTSAQRATDDIYTGAEQDVFLTPPGFFPQHFSPVIGQFGIPGGCKGSTGWEIGGRVGRPVGIAPVVPVDFRADPVRTVTQAPFGNAQAFNLRDVEFRVPV